MTFLPGKRKKILISACLIGAYCRYDGKRCKDMRFLSALPYAEWVPVCPERLGHLPTPRIPSEISGGDGNDVLAGKASVLAETGDDVSLSFIEGAKKTLAIAEREKVDIAILKSKSPSCGCGSIYDGSFSGRLKKGDGITTALLKQADIPCLSSEEIGYDVTGPDSS
jgi:uncharacterized protein YbbK (DUF523 family)